MKYCPNCGSQVPENANNCPQCGTPLGGGQPNVINNINVNQQNYSRPTIGNKNIVTSLILSILTCGIYSLIWYVNIVDDVNRVCQDENNQSGGIVLLLTIITCGIYGFYYFYTAGKRLADAGTKTGVAISDNSLIYLLLSLFGLQIINYCLIQSDLNKFSA